MEYEFDAALIQRLDDEAVEVGELAKQLFIARHLNAALIRDLARARSLVDLAD